MQELEIFKKTENAAFSILYPKTNKNCIKNIKNLINFH